MPGGPRRLRAGGAPRHAFRMPRHPGVRRAARALFAVGALIPFGVRAQSAGATRRGRLVPLPPSGAAPAHRRAHRERPPRRRLLAAEGGLPDHRHARSGPRSHLGRREHPLPEQLARHAALSVDVPGTESVRADEHHERPRSAAAQVPRQRVRLLVPGVRRRPDARLRAGGAIATPPTPSTAPTMRVDLATPLAPGAALDLDAAWSFKVPEQGGGRMGHDGAAVRDRPVVSAHGGVRRRPRLEPRTVHRRRRVLPRVRRLRRLAHRAGQLHRPRYGRAAEPGHRAHAHRDRPARAGPDVRHHGARDLAPGVLDDFSAVPAGDPGRRSPGTSRRATRATSPGRPAPISSGTPAAGTAS